MSDTRPDVTVTLSQSQLDLVMNALRMAEIECRNLARGYEDRAVLLDYRGGKGSEHEWSGMTLASESAQSYANVRTDVARWAGREV